ncbi:dirigent protein 11 [Cryptomeria japonica]|uniref:dirigent protein 11 n=1 Tax=Cryptomeria japonica TaxID=3369 RepID=UPI0025AB79E9|nr:dirigent protein 11 [Cryptomeria japonica]
MAAQKLFLGLVFLALMSCSWCLGPEKNIVFYMHDIVSKPNSTATVVAGVNGTSSNLLGFGTVLVIDDLLTEKPDRSSTVVGRAKGLYSNSDVKGATIFFGLSVVFENKEYNGSTLQIQGTDPFMQSSEKEVSVVGGIGKLRYARGYAIITLQSSSGLDGNIKFNTTFCIG